MSDNLEKQVAIATKSTTEEDDSVSEQMKSMETSKKRLKEVGAFNNDCYENDSCDLDTKDYEDDGDDDDDDDFDKSFADTTQRTSKSSEEDDSDEDPAKMIAKKEHKAVLRLRLLVFDFLLVATIGISLIVYITTTRAEKHEYEKQYESASNKVLEVFLDIAQTKLAAVSSLSMALAIQGEQADTQWPFLTLQRFQEQASNVMTQSGALYLHVNPLVTLEQRDGWETYVTGADSLWIEEGLQYQDNMGMLNFSDMPDKLNEHSHVADRWPIWFRNLKGVVVADKGKGPYLPTWMASPIVYNGQEVNENILKNARSYMAANESISTESVIIEEFMMAPPGDMYSEEDRETALFALLMSMQEQQAVAYQGDPLSQVFYPVFDAVEGDKDAVAVVVAWIRWLSYFEGILTSEMKGIYFILHDSCGSSYTYVINGEAVDPIGEGDLHQTSYNDMMRNTTFASIEQIKDGTEEGLPIKHDRCTISIQVYPSNDFHSIYNTNLPAFMTAAVVVIFLCTSLLFIAYDRLVERRQRLVVASAQQTNAIVSSLFPKNVRDRLMNLNAPAGDKDKKGSFMAPNRRLKGYLSGDHEDDGGMAPIADLFPHCTVMFCDISGFTAWSSTRDPSQVFILLQTVYQAFDKIAKRRKVFKVETIGDSYVAVTGLPEPQVAHAVIMARFAAECRLKMNELVNRLEKSLGPDTADLSMRFGLHSGPVTAGVLRGERARFQLFGDTVNTAARMESTGERDMIQVSHVTYGFLVESGKQAWVKPRIDRVNAKGIGTMRTYWLHLNVRERRNSLQSQGMSNSSGDDTSTTNIDLGGNGSDSNLDLATSHIPTSVSKLTKSEVKAAAKKQARMVDWMCDLFHDQIRKVVALRKPRSKAFKAKYTHNENQTSLDEVAEVIYLPRFHETIGAGSKDLRNVHVGPLVYRQLHEYITIIASHYHNNPFHNFEHACHVTMATNKFLTRIVTPDIAADGDVASKLHSYTHGINSDPLTILAILFSALVHDVDHRGVSNGQLIKEHKEMGDKYRNKSVAEQNSLDLSWELLMEGRFDELRYSMFTSDKELQRFRQVLVNVVLATDIFDAELNGLRKNRWQRAFSSTEGLSDEENNDLRATIVIEHIIQASDVSHTMQHWHIYRKWNKRLFEELYKAYCEGRMEKDPSTFWYKGEIGFFDNYIIPLAKKLKECNVFGVSSDECLNYAIQNRDEWKEKGEEIVSEMMEDVASKNIRPV